MLDVSEIWTRVNTYCMKYIPAVQQKIRNDNALWHKLISVDLCWFLTSWNKQPLPTSLKQSPQDSSFS